MRSSIGLLLFDLRGSDFLWAAECIHLVGLSHCVVRVMWFKYWIRPDAVLLSSQLATQTYTHTQQWADMVKQPQNQRVVFCLAALSHRMQISYSTYLYPRTLRQHLLFWICDNRSKISLWDDKRFPPNSLTHLEDHCQTADCSPPQGLLCLSGPSTADSLQQHMAHRCKRYDY